MVALLEVSLIDALLGVGRWGRSRKRRRGDKGQNLNGLSKEKLRLAGGARTSLDRSTRGEGERVWGFMLLGCLMHASWSTESRSVRP